MSREALFTPGYTPSSMITARKVADLAEEALIAAYPPAEQHKGLLIQNTALLTPVEVMDAQSDCMPMRELPWYKIFRQLGIPDARLQPYYNWASIDHPYFTDYENSKTYMPKALLAAFHSPESYNRALAVMAMGFTYIEDNIRVLGYRVNPTIQPSPLNFFWRIGMAEQTEHFLAEMESSFSGKDKVKFRRSKKQATAAFTKEGETEMQASYVAVGAKILYRVGDQPLMHAEHTLGRNLDTGIVLLLSEKVKRDFLQKARQSGILERPIQIQTSPLQVSAQRICKILALEDQELFLSYIYSLLPLEYMESTDPALNPFCYPEEVNL